MSHTHYPLRRLMVCSCVLATPISARAETVLHSFQTLPHGNRPHAALIRDAAGNLYGTTLSGGSANFGVVYRIDASGQEKVLYSFLGGSDGANPCGGLTHDSAGNLYGTTYAGGQTNPYGGASIGIIYKLDATGKETVLGRFSDPGAPGGNPASGVIRDSAGNLYGTTTLGGYYGTNNFGYGTVYKFDTSGKFTLLHAFTNGADGANPNAGVTMDSAGNLYGTTPKGGSAGYGIVYKIDTTGKETVLYTFTGGADGGSPYSGVMLDSAGDLFGTTQMGGTGAGVVYKLSAAGKETVLHTFSGGSAGSAPYAGVIRDAEGNFYGTTIGDNGTDGGTAGASVVYKLDTKRNYTVLATNSGAAYGGLVRDPAGNLYGTVQSGEAMNAGLVYEVSGPAQQTVLYSFPATKDGANPYGSLIRDSAGNLYGTASEGGTTGNGTVFKLDSSGHETVLHNFTGADGSCPEAALVRDSAGNFYGTTLGGGGDYGVVFKIDTKHNFRVLYNFTGGADGCRPTAPLALDSAGNLYGTAAACGSTGNGVVYKLNRAGQQTVLYSFAGGSDGSMPWAGIVRDQEGNLYGTTAYGGVPWPGTVYKIDTSGNETQLATGVGAPWGGVILDSSGNLYGTGDACGALSLGCVYKIDTTGTWMTLYSFMGGTDGQWPHSGVILDSGNLYGTTYGGGSWYQGTVYKVDLNGHETLLYSFTGGADGGTPWAGVIIDSAGNLYGTTTVGGYANAGVVFRIP